MRKNKLFIILAIITILIFLVTAATCNMCGITPQQETTEEEAVEEEEAGEETTSEESEIVTQEDIEEVVENSSPVIEEIILFGLEAVMFDVLNPEVQESLLQNFPAGAGELKFSIEASDKNNDDLEYFASDDRGNNFEVSKLSNNEAEFNWNTPSETGPIVINIRVSDGRGGEDSYDVNINLVTEEEENNCPTINLVSVNADYSGTLPCSTDDFFVCYGTDPDGDELTYDWDLSVGTINGITSVTDPGPGSIIAFTTPAIQGTISLTVTVSDGICEVSETEKIEIRGSELEPHK